MKYCTVCGSEYREGVERCADCESSELVSAEEMKRRGLRIAGEQDTRKFEIAGTAEDPLSAEQLTALLEEAKIPVFSRPRRTGTVDPITAASPPWWELLVPEEHLERASALIAEEQARMEAGADDAARAAEEEEAETEAAAKAAT